MTNIGKTISGKEFNESHEGYKFVKILADNLTHHGFEYKEGLNIDNVIFNPTGKCSVGGLYFTDLNEAYLYFHYGNKFSYVTIPDEALVYIKKNKFKANMFILTNILPLSELFLQNIQLCELVVKQRGLALKYIENQTEELCKLAVEQNAYALEYVKDQTVELCKLAIQQNGNALQFVRNQTEEICKLAVKQNGLALEFVKEQTEEICKLAVEQNGLALEFVKDQTEELCKLAVIQNGLALMYVKDQTAELCKLAMEQNEA